MIIMSLQKESEWEKNPIRYEEGMPVVNESGIYRDREGLNMDEWTVSFIAETLHFAQTKSIGEDASSLTKKLRKKIKEAITTAVSTREKEIAEEIKKIYPFGGHEDVINKILSILKH